MNDDKQTLTDEACAVIDDTQTIADDAYAMNDDK